MGKFLTEKKKRKILVYLILWLLLAIVLIVPFSVAIQDSTYNGNADLDTFASIILNYICSFKVRVKAFEEAYKASTITALEYYSFFYAAAMLVLILKSKSHEDYHDIEHGSSDWSEGGEQYKVLSKKEGIILAEKNYLPVDKKGNVNVLIVGRIRCW